MANSCLTSISAQAQQIGPACGQSGSRREPHRGQVSTSRDGIAGRRRGHSVVTRRSRQHAYGPVRGVTCLHEIGALPQVSAILAYGAVRTVTAPYGSWRTQIRCPQGRVGSNPTSGTTGTGREPGAQCGTWRRRRASRVRLARSTSSAGTGSTETRPRSETCSVQQLPFHSRYWCLPVGSRCHPGFRRTRRSHNIWGMPFRRPPIHPPDRAAWYAVRGRWAGIETALHGAPPVPLPRDGVGARHGGVGRHDRRARRRRLPAHPRRSMEGRPPRAAARHDIETRLLLGEDPATVAADADAAEARRARVYELDADRTDDEA